MCDATTGQCLCKEVGNNNVAIISWSTVITLIPIVVETGWHRYYEEFLVRSNLFPSLLFLHASSPIRSFLFVSRVMQKINCYPKSATIASNAFWDLFNHEIFLSGLRWRQMWSLRYRILLLSPLQAVWMRWSRNEFSRVQHNYWSMSMFCQLHRYNFLISFFQNNFL